MSLFGKKSADKDDSRAPYRAIADMLGIPAGRQNFIDRPLKYYGKNADMYEERWVEEDDGEDAIIWIGIANELLTADKAREFDWKEDLSNFASGLAEIMPDGLTADMSILDRDGDIPSWAKTLNEAWSGAGYVLACMDIDSDSYVTFICKKDMFERLSDQAGRTGHRIALAQDM